MADLGARDLAALNRVLEWLARDDMRNALPELIRLARLGLEAERRTADLTGEAMRDCIEYLHKNDGFRSLRVRVFDGEIKLEILTAAKGLEPIAEARGSLFHDAVATLKDEWG